jgi:voltage-dependent calcium channel
VIPGVVVENFSYVFQTSTGGAKSITREQMRSFKKVWAEFANPQTGYLERPQFVRFFGVSVFCALQRVIYSSTPETERGV